MIVFSSTLDSIVESVDTAEESVRRCARDAGFGESDQFFIGLAIREIVTNAMKHGNRFDPAKKVGFEVSLDGRDLIMDVTDQGAGFDVESVPDPLRPENLERQSGRGIVIARKIMDELSVTANSPCGAHVHMVKRLKSATQ
jgi:serine/threonine-protein kinase RsbW